MKDACAVPRAPLLEGGPNNLRRHNYVPLNLISVSIARWRGLLLLLQFCLSLSSALLLASHKLGTLIETGNCSRCTASILLLKSRLLNRSLQCMLPIRNPCQDGLPK